MRTFWFGFLALLLVVIRTGASQLLQPGQPFPAWELVDQSGAKVSSTSLAGKTYLLWFYPKAMTPGCTKEGCQLRDNFRHFAALGVEILGVSFDSASDNARFAEKEGFPFRLLSDTDRRLAVAVGAADSPQAAYARRISYLVGPDGRVLRVYPQVDPNTHAREVLDDLKALQEEK